MNDRKSHFDPTESIGSKFLLHTWRDFLASATRSLLVLFSIIAFPFLTLYRTIFSVNHRELIIPEVLSNSWKNAKDEYHSRRFSAVIKIIVKISLLLTFLYLFYEMSHDLHADVSDNFIIYIVTYTFCFWAFLKGGWKDRVFATAIFIKNSLITLFITGDAHHQIFITVIDTMILSVLHAFSWKSPSYSAIFNTAIILFIGQTFITYFVKSETGLMAYITDHVQVLWTICVALVATIYTFILYPANTSEAQHDNAR